MQIYLPVAEIAINMFTLVGMGAAVGFLSGMFGVGGGFLITPLLIFLGISPAVAVATGANQVIAASVSGAIAHLRRGSVDLPLGGMLLIGGVIGSVIGVALFRLLLELGYVDTAVSISYVFFLGIVGALMLVESLKTLHNRLRGNEVPARRPGNLKFVQRLPLKMKFKRSKLFVSVIPVILLGALVGILAAVMGVGGGFIMVPAMIYLLRVPTSVVIGTSLFQIVFVAAITTLLHAVANQTVDIVLALLLMVGGVVGAQIGARTGQKLKADTLRALLALLVLLVCARLFAGLVMTPEEAFSITVA